MARTSDSHQTGAVAVSGIQEHFERINWGPVRNPDHDLGTDFLIAARDDRRFDVGMVGAQAKGGPSFFEHEVRDNGVLRGWWYYEPSVEHFEGWVRHPLPHLVVIHDVDTHISYWAHVTPDAVKRVGKGCRVFIPIEQTVDTDHLDALLEVAVSGRRSEAVERTAFAAAAESISPGRRTRHALLAPRLVAPHRNTGYDRVLQPEEALALIALGRFVDLDRFAEQHEAVPDPRSHELHRDWRWRLVRAFWTWAETDDFTGLQALMERTPDPAAKAAVSVLVMMALRRAERITEALGVADALVVKDDLSPVDQAWVLVHRARLRVEIGELETATSDALAALRYVKGEQDDPTASAVGAAAAWLLFLTADLEQHQVGVGEALTAADTAVTWWRGQLVVGALEEAITREFRNWAEDRARRWVVEDTERLNLFASELNADLAADYGSWRGHCALRSRDLLITAEDEDDLVNGLDGLRRSGDAESLQLAARHIRATGPVNALGSALKRMHAESWTHTTFKTNLTLLAVGGDLLPPDEATSAALDCIAFASDDRADIVRALRPTFIVPLDALEALAGLLPAAEPNAHEAAAEILFGGELSAVDVLQAPLARVVCALDLRALGHGHRDAVRNFAFSDKTPLAAAILGRFKADGDEEAGLELRDRAGDGDSYALGAHGDVRTLTTEEATQQVKRFAARVRQTVADAAHNSYSIGELDPMRELAVFNLWFPDVAEWNVLLEALEDLNVAAEGKANAALVLMSGADRIPNDIRQRVASLGDVLRATTPRGVLGGRDLGGLPATLTAATAELDEDTKLALLMPLVTGTATERYDIAHFLSFHDVPRLRAALAGLASDEAIEVRVSAAQTIGRRAALDPSDPILVTLAAHIATDAGTRAPLALLHGLRHDGIRAVASLDLVLSNLRWHPASEVARAAQQAFPATPSEG